MYVCVLASVIQGSNRMLGIVSLSVACLVTPYVYFSTLSHKRHDLRKIVNERKTSYYFLYNFCLKHFSFCQEFKYFRKCPNVFM